ncbi:thioredoxin-like domain-containing protein [uncultured Sphaerochaeta sp.]|uniref:peroxiredoxin family protein n=1 Tax=uncultured Sphaerochaeta sp. TaxID=886478 RepID=UPI0029CA03CF|nr:thioredoxin-like domain-containing protein [uncultured Sphaerochaeta sp.]
MKRILAMILLGLLLLSGCKTIPNEPMNSYEKIVRSAHNRQGNPVAVNADYLLVYYAADWCPYCVEYAEELKQKYSQYKRMYGDKLEIIFAGHVNDQSDENLLAFLDQGEYPFPYIPFSERESSGVMELLGEHRFYIPGFLLLDREGTILSSSNGATKEEYLRDRPLYELQTLLSIDCAVCTE